MLVQQEPTEFEHICIILETAEQANKFRDLIEFATNHATKEGLDFELGNEICDFFCFKAVVPND